MGRRVIWKIRGMEGRRKRGMEDGNNEGQREKTFIKYGRMGRREIWKIGGMKGRRREEGRTRGKEGYNVWKKVRNRDMEDRRNGRKEMKGIGGKRQYKRKRRM